MRGRRASAIRRSDFGQPMPIGSLSGPSRSIEMNSRKMKLNSSVVTTSSTPKRTLSRAGTSKTSAPASIDEMASAGNRAKAPHCNIPVPNTTVINAPAYSCASAPMFHSRARKATATDSPVKISGVARFSVSSSANFDPNAPLRISPSTENGFAPAAMASSEATTTVEAMAMAGGRVVRQIDGLATGSRRMGGLRFKAMSGHPDPQFGGRFAATGKPGRQAAFGNDVNHVRQRHDFVEVFGNQQYSRPPVACGQKLRVDIVHRANIQTTHRLIGKDDAGVGLKHATKDQFLHIAARQKADAGVWAGAPHIIDVDHVAGERLGAAPVHPARAAVGRPVIGLKDRILGQVKLGYGAGFVPVFGNAGDPCLNGFSRGPGIQVGLVQLQSPGRGTDQPSDQIGQRALTIARHPGKADDLPGAQRQRYPLEARRAAPVGC